ncbi:MAG: glycosyltransferase family 2 protein [Pyrinomonadaceae bacterium]|nr:glycosyltransferase family 2 protein [Pyrinomonadaceae bacterium]
MFVFYFFAIIQIFLGYKSLRGGFDFLAYFKQELNNEPSDYKPFASVIVPCRGIDKDLVKNLEAITSQNYPDYEVVFVVEDRADEAFELIDEIKAAAPGTHLVMAGKATDSGQKVHNLREAVLKISNKSEVIVFVDSDARPGRNWLQHLVGPLKNYRIGCSTGYRWFVQKNGGFPTHLRSVWNASIASSLGGDQKRNFCWGGSTAIRRSVFEDLEVRKRWKGTLSDDFALTSILKEAGLQIHFVPQCLTATVEDCSFRELLEFSTRQIKITRVYSPAHFRVSLIGSALFTGTLLTGIFLLFIASGLHFWITLLAVSAILALGLAKARVRLQAVRLILRDYKDELSRQVLPQLTLWLITPFLYLYNNIRALLSREIVWRGIRYELVSANKTVIIKKNEE